MRGSSAVAAHEGEAHYGADTYEEEQDGGEAQDQGQSTRLLAPEARDGGKDGAGICWVGATSCADGETRAPPTPQWLSPAATMFAHRAQ